MPRRQPTHPRMVKPSGPRRSAPEVELCIPVIDEESTKGRRISMMITMHLLMDAPKSPPWKGANVYRDIGSGAVFVGAVFVDLLLIRLRAQTHACGISSRCSRQDPQARTGRSIVTSAPSSYACVRSNLMSCYCTFGNCKLVFFRTRVDRYGGALVVLGMSENPGKPSFRSPNGLLAPFLA